MEPWSCVISRGLVGIINIQSEGERGREGVHVEKKSRGKKADVK